MPKGIPKSGINKGWFKKGSSINLGRKRPDMLNNVFREGLEPWNKGLTGYSLPSRKNPKGKKAHHWKGGKIKRIDGYLAERIANQYLLQHRLVMETAIGRKLKSSEIVHHINGDRSDNKLENLRIFQSPGEHIKYHQEIDSFGN